MSERNEEQYTVEQLNLAVDLAARPQSPPIACLSSSFNVRALVAASADMIRTGKPIEATLMSLVSVSLRAGVLLAVIDAEADIAKAMDFRRADAEEKPVVVS